MPIFLRHYVFVQTEGNWSQTAYLKASNTKAENYFGTSVAISWDTIVVGADHEGADVSGVLNGTGTATNAGAESSGAGYVYTRSEEIWTQQAYLKASDLDAFDYFGCSVAISETGDTIVVGARGEASNMTGVTNGSGGSSDNGSNFSGAAYVFQRTDGLWSQQAYLKAPNTGAGDQFGFAVGVSFDRVIVGAPYEDGSATGVGGANNNSATDAGAAYVYVRNGSLWSHQAYIKASNTGAGDRFGYSVSISGQTFVVGSPSEDSNATGVNGANNNNALDAGAAYVFVDNGTSWLQQAYLKASNTEQWDEFGSSVAISGNTIAVGAPYESSNVTGVLNGMNAGSTDNSKQYSGAVYVFGRDRTNAWSQQAYMKASNTNNADAFGFSVGVSADLVVAGSPGESSNATGVLNGQGGSFDGSALNAGAAYVFSRSDFQWQQQAYLKASNGVVSDRFGQSVAVSGETVVIGARGESGSSSVINGAPDNNAPRSGAA